MKITLYQQDIKWLDPEANYRKIESVLSSQRDSDLLVLPEMCTTGFVTIPGPGEIEYFADVEQRLLDLSRRYQTAICGSFAISLSTQSEDCLKPENNRNRCYFVMPEGEIRYYDKHHLFNIGAENRGYLPGQDQCVVTWRGIRFFLIVCYDLRFPVWSKYTERNSYDILVCVANWPEKRQLAWETLLPARAIENQVYVIGVNRVGADVICGYRGGTCAIHPYGHVLARCPEGEECFCSFTPDMQKLEDFRRKFPSQADSDRFSIL
jgi:predicted amidohydrolase